LVLIETILDYGHAGMPIEAVDDFSVRHPFVSSRLVLLVSARIIDDDGQSLRFRGRIGLLLWVSDAYRRLCGRQTATG